jgi:hypothetical protein
MTVWDYIIGGVGTSLQAAILARAFQTRSYRYYAFFYAAIAWGFLDSLLFIYFILFESLQVSRALFWIGRILPLIGFLIAWEVYRQIFSPFPHLRRRAGQAVSLVLLLLVAASFAADFAARPLHKFPFLAIEWQCRLAQGAFLVLSLALARFYGIPLGRNVFGMAVGFGLFVSVAVANFALRNQFGAAYPFLWYVSSLTSLACYAIWSWSLWDYAPNPKPQPELSLRGERQPLDTPVDVAWTRVFDALKKGFGR